jgi:PhnB protein
MAVKAIPEGFRTITPYFNVREPIQFIEFLKQAFDAKDTYVAKLPDGSLLSAEVRVGDSVVIVGADVEDRKRGESHSARVKLWMYVKDVDAVYKKAIQAGAKSIEEPADQFWGDRSGVVKDPEGNEWWIATHKEDMSTEELVRRATSE